MWLVSSDILGSVNWHSPSIPSIALIENLGADPCYPGPSEEGGVVVWLPEPYRMEKASTGQIHVGIWVANLGMLLENRGYDLPESLRDLVVLVIRTYL